MKIRLAILEKDINYLRRIVSAFNIKYADKLEIYSFTDVKSMLEELDNSRIDVILADELFEIDVKKLPERCGFAYFVDDHGIESYKNQQAICKFQKADLIYKQILSIYAEKASAITGFSLDEASSKIISFISAGGGTGSSTVAVAYAKRMAAKQKKVLYLNFEQFGDAGLYFHGEGQADFSDIIYALRSQRSNLNLKLESTIRQDASGVFFYAAPKVALDIRELRLEDVKRLMMETRNSGSYDYIVLDSDFGLDDFSYTIWREANNVVLVTDGEEISNRKIERMFQTFRILEKKDDGLRLGKVALFYNRFSNKTGNTLQEPDIAEIGGVPRYEHATKDMLVKQISTLEVLDKIM